MIPGLDIILGGVTGLVGNALTSIVNFKTQKMQNEHELNKIKYETEAMKEEAKMQIAVTKAQVEGEVELADSNAYMEGIKAGNEKSFSDKWIDKLFEVTGWVRYISIPFGVLIASAFAFVDFLRGFMRPALTMYLTGMTTYITYLAWKIIETKGLQVMSGDQAIGIYNQVTSIVVYLTVSCVTWWFADRRTAKFLQTLNKNKTNGV